MTSVPFVLIFGLWFSLFYRLWWPVGIAAAVAVALSHVAFRYVPLAPISRFEVMAFRVGGVLLAAFLIGSVVLSVLGYL